jgi:hypothetical protein
MITGVHFPRIFPFPKFPLRRVFLFLTLTFFLVSCNPIYIARIEEDFQAIPDLEKRVAEEKDAPVRAKYHLQLAWLYSNHENPKIDYRKALEQFELYLSLVPEKAQTDEIQNWLSVLRALDRLERENDETRLALEDQNKKNQILQENMENLRERNASLEEVNTDLKKAIERLKNLNLQVEKKKKSLH